ncbi:hypothetical protein GC175_11960 [bacterium]|nr:hypothetical protein [bacterium]
MLRPVLYIYAPTAGTGSMGFVFEKHVKRRNPDANLDLFGQEYTPEAFALLNGAKQPNLKFSIALPHAQILIDKPSSAHYTVIDKTSIVDKTTIDDYTDDYTVDRYIYVHKQYESA